MTIDRLTEIFCQIDDFCQEFEPAWRKSQMRGNNCRNRGSRMKITEVMTILVGFQTSSYRTLKHFYMALRKIDVCAFNYVSYSNFVRLISSSLLPLLAFMHKIRAKCTGISFIDSTCIKVCHNCLIFQNKVFKGLAERGKSTMGWFFGFKLHLGCVD